MSDTPIIQKLRAVVGDGNDGTFGTVAMHGSSVIGGRVSALLAEIDTLTARLAAAESEVLTLRTMQVARKAWTADVDRDYKSDHGEYFHASCGLCGSAFYGGKGRVVCAVCKPTGELLAQIRQQLAAAEEEGKRLDWLVDKLCVSEEMTMRGTKRPFLRMKRDWPLPDDIKPRSDVRAAIDTARAEQRTQKTLNDP